MIYLNQLWLEENAEVIESYNIKGLFYVAFFGGIIPMVWLGTKMQNEIILIKKRLTN